MANKKISFDKIMTKWECISDKIVSVFLTDKLVNKVESLDFMQKLVKSSFINSLQKFWKGWFKQIFIIWGYLSIIFWLITILSGFFSLLRLYMIPAVISVIFWVLTLVMWFWAIKFKKWYPFVALIQGWIYLVFLILNYLILSFYASGPFMMRPSFVWLFINIIVFLAIFIVYYVLVLKNKWLFTWEMIKKVKKVKTKKKEESEKVTKKEKKEL